MPKSHEYKSRLTWDGNLGTGTETYQGYSRDYTVSRDGKPDIRGSADPMFRGNKDLPNPEEWFIAALSSCHMLSYLALCARKGVSVVSYEDSASGALIFNNDGGGRFDEVILRPVVKISDPAKLELAKSLHDDAHHQCYIASSSSSIVRHEAVVTAVSE